MAYRQVGIYLVAVAAPNASPLHIARANEVGDDRLSGTLGDTDPGSDVSPAYAGILRKAHQHVAVVGQERPRRLALLGRSHLSHRLLMVPGFANY